MLYVVNRLEIKLYSAHKDIPSKEITKGYARESKS